MRPGTDYRAERRLAPRQRVLKGGRLKFNKGYSVFECIVRNRSVTGVLLDLGDTSAIPGHFDLDIAGEKLPRAVTVRWRNMTALGVSFD
jgi:hypothetical protein